MHVVFLFFSRLAIVHSDLKVFFVNPERSVTLSLLTFTVEVAFGIRHSRSNFAKGAAVFSLLFDAQQPRHEVLPDFQVLPQAKGGKVFTLAACSCKVISAQAKSFQEVVNDQVVGAFLFKIQYRGLVMLQELCQLFLVEAMLLRVEISDLVWNEVLV